MFERFTASARATVVGAQEEARALGHCWIGTEHLLLGVLRPGSGVAEGLEPLGVTHAAVRAELVRTVGPGPASGHRPGSDTEDDEALRRIGIDIDAVRRRVEEQFGPGALAACPAAAPRGRWWWRGRRPASPPRGRTPFTRRAKKALELALREAVAGASGDIAAEHVVLGLLRADGLAGTLVEGVGASAAQVRAVLLDRLRRAA